MSFVVCSAVVTTVFALMCGRVYCSYKKKQRDPVIELCELEDVDISNNIIDVLLYEDL